MEVGGGTCHGCLCLQLLWATDHGQKQTTAITHRFRYFWFNHCGLGDGYDGQTQILTLNRNFFCVLWLGDSNNQVPHFLQPVSVRTEWTARPRSAHSQKICQSYQGGLTSTQLVVLIHCNYDRGRRYSDLSLVSMREPFIATPTRLFAIVPYLSFACPFTCSLRGSSHHVATFSSLAPHFCMSYHSCSSTNLVHHTTRYYTNDPSYNIKIT